MKSQIALIGVGLAIAAGVAYAELKPANNAPTAPVVSTPKPSKSNTPAPAATPTKSKIVTKAKTPAPKKSAAPKIALKSFTIESAGSEALVWLIMGNE